MEMLDLPMIVALLMSIICGGLIGYLREIEGKVAGLRTHILVCMGSTLFMLISEHSTSISSIADPSRIAAGVVTGIGFLGAGAIIQDGGSVRGITTAASIWVTCAIGLALASNMIWPAVLTTFLALVVLRGLRHIETKVLKSKEHSEK